MPSTAVSSQSVQAPDVQLVRAAGGDANGKGRQALQEFATVFPDLLGKLEAAVEQAAAAPPAEAQTSAVAPQTGGQPSLKSVLAALANLARADATATLPGATTVITAGNDGAPASPLAAAFALLDLPTADQQVSSDQGKGSPTDVTDPRPDLKPDQAIAALQLVLSAFGAPPLADTAASDQTARVPAAPGAAEDKAVPVAKVAFQAPVAGLGAAADAAQAQQSLAAAKLSTVQATPSTDQVATAAAWTVTRRETHFSPFDAPSWNPEVKASASATDAGGGGKVALPGVVPVSAAAVTAVGPFNGERDFSALGQAGQPVKLNGELKDVSAPGQQVFQQIMSQLETAVDNPAPAPAPTSQSPSIVWRDNAVAQPLKTIEIALQPADLGTVTLKLSVKHDVLRVELDVARSDTAGLLERDKDMLTSLVKSAGYQIDGVSVRHVDQQQGGVSLSADTPGLTRDAPQQGASIDFGAGSRSSQGQRHPQGAQQQPTGAQRAVGERTNGAAGGTSTGPTSAIYI